MELIEKDPTEFAYVKKDKQTIEELGEGEILKYLKKEVLALFLKTAKKYGLEHDYLAFLILSYSGIRAGELIALKWKDIDFVIHTISITKTYYNEKDNTFQYQLLPPKTKRSRRRIIVDEEVINTLINHKEAQN